MRVLAHDQQRGADAVRRSAGDRLIQQFVHANGKGAQRQHQAAQMRKVPSGDGLGAAVSAATTGSK